MPPGKKAAPAAPKPTKVKGIAQWCQEDTAVRSKRAHMQQNTMQALSKSILP